MVPQYENNAMCSVYLWALWKVLQYGQAYITLTTPLFYVPDPTLPPAYIGYSAPFKSWVYDSGVSGAWVINSVSGGQYGELGRASGVHIDYPNGRVIIPASLGTNLSLTGTYSMNEVNVYQPNETEEEILTQGKFFRNPRFLSPPTGGIPPYVYATPAIFVNTLHQTTDAYQFGGLNDCTTTFSFTLFCESNYQLQALLSIFRDTKYQNIPLLNIANDPLDGFGDVKGGSGYNYVTYQQRYGTPGNLIYIKDIKTSKVSDVIKMNPQYFVGIADLEVGYVRQSPLQPNSFG